jgi:aminocarboxymuconate-semialdehyde decarboxylase
MFYKCSPDCSDPKHRHQVMAATTHKFSLKKNIEKNVSSKKKANVSGKKFKVVDAHCHYLNPEVNAKYAYLKPGMHDATAVFATELSRMTNQSQIKERGLKFSNVTERLKDMNKMGVDVQVLSPAPIQYFYFTEPDVGANISRDINESIAKVVADNPDRFVGLGTVPLQNVDLAIKELEYAVKDLGLRGVEICTNVNGLNLTDPALGLEKFFAKATELGAVVFLHPMGFSQGERLVEHYFNNVIGNPFDTSLALAHLIFDGVLARHPKLKILAAHGGGFLASYWARMDHAWKARPDARTVIKKKPSYYLEKVFFDTITHDSQILGNLINRYGAKRFMLGTDYPFDMGEETPRQLIAGVTGLTQDDKELIEGLNAMKLFKIK